MRIKENSLNRLSVLKAIRRYGPVSRSELPGLTGLSAGAITKLTSHILERGLIVERKEETKRAHRPRVHLEIAANGALVIGASVEGQGLVTTAFVDLAGERLFSFDAAFAAPATLNDLADRIAGGLKEAIAASPFEAVEISRIGIALPALVDSQRGLVHFMTTFPVGPVEIAGKVADQLDVPVTIENDFTCMARAEHWFGRASDLETFSMIHLGYSVGSAHYIDGVPASGTNGLNPEIGHTKVDFGSGARHCICGAKGCLIAYSSMYGILREAGLLDDALFPAVESLDALFERFLDNADAGDNGALQLLREAGIALGRAVANFLNAADPGNVLISTFSDRFHRYILADFERTLLELTMPGVIPATNIDFILTNQDWRWTGTAALALEQAYLGTERERNEKASIVRLEPLAD